MSGHLHQIWRFPVKSLGGEPLAETLLAPNRLLPHDRRFAIAYGSRREVIDGSWAAKTAFFNLARDERLAQLQASFEAESGILTLYRSGKQVARGKATDPMGRTLLDQFLSAFLAPLGRGPARLQERSENGFTDVKDALVSLINLSSVRDLERVLGQTADPVRFRGNLLLGGLHPWQERGWLGRRLRIGDAELQVCEPIGRCAATEVNPESGQRDLPVLKGLASGFDHAEMGVYAEVLNAARIQPGDEVELLH